MPVSVNRVLTSASHFGQTDVSSTLNSSVNLTMTDGYYVGPKDCRGAVAFTAAPGAVVGGWCQMTLIADGTNTPSFPAAWKAAYGSQAWTSTAGVVHVVTIWYDGFFYWYSIAPGASTVYGLTMHSLYVDGTSLVMSSNIAMSTAATPAVGCFTVTAGGATIAVSSVTIASTYIVLTLASPVTYGQTVTLTIDRDGTNYPRANTDGGKLAVPVVAASVTNYTDAAAAATLPNFTFLATKTANFSDETATGLPWKCGVSSASGSWEYGRMGSAAGAGVSAGAGVDFSVEFTYMAGMGSAGVYSHSGTGGALQGSATLYVYVKNSDSKIYHHAVSGSETLSGGGGGITATEGMRIRARRNTSGNWQVEYSTDGGTNWSVAAADVITGSSSTQYPFAAVFGATGYKCFRPRHRGYS